MGFLEVYEDSNVRVSTSRDAKSYAVIVRARSGAASRIELLNTPWDVRAVRRVATDKILIDQPSSGDSEELYVFDAQSGLLLEKFWCEHPSLSPDKGYLAFIAAHPMHSPDEDLTSDFVMLYQFAGDVTINHDRSRVDFPLLDVPDRRLGLQVFPSRRSPIKLILAGGKKRRTYAVLSEFTWSPDSSQFLFVDEQKPGVVDFGGIDKRIPTRSRAEEPSLLLVDVNVKNQRPVVTAMPAPGCSRISGLNCKLQIGQTEFGIAELHVMESISGRETLTRTLDIPYAGFRSLAVE